MSQTLFISDLHLEEKETKVTNLFLDFLKNIPAPGDTLYILGDLFEVWLGDDTLGHPFNQEIVEALWAVSQRKISIHALRGNRDFLLGDTFAHLAGLTLHQEPIIIQLQEFRTILLHGDILCTDDVDYQQFRTQVHTPQWQRAFLKLTLEERIQQARNLRETSNLSKAVKIMSIMDATEEAIQAQLTEHHAQAIVHGHTHRPAVHQHHTVKGLCYRWVLPAWDLHAGYLQVVEGMAPQLRYLT